MLFVICLTTIVVIQISTVDRVSMSLPVSTMSSGVTGRHTEISTLKSWVRWWLSRTLRWVKVRLRHSFNPFTLYAMYRSPPIYTHCGWLVSSSHHVYGHQWKPCRVWEFLPAPRINIVYITLPSLGHQFTGSVTAVMFQITLSTCLSSDLVHYFYVILSLEQCLYSFFK